MMRITRTALTSALLACAVPLALPSPAAAASAYYVSPTGSDTNPGTSVGAPLATVQRALDLAPSGAVVRLAPGTYRQDFTTRRPGVTVTGPSSAVVRGAGEIRVIQVQHDRTVLDGFTVDGLHGAPDSAAGYRAKLIYAMSTTPGDGVDRLRISNMTIRNALDECVRLRYLVTRAEVYGNTIRNCGVDDFRFGAGGKNGEGIYLGTDPGQQGTNGAPDAAPDVSRDNRIHHNTIDTRGNECVDIKENSTANLVEHNDCTGQRDTSSGGLDARGSGNTFRYNTVHDNLGAGVRLGGVTPEEGLRNNVYGNTITGNAKGGIKIMTTPQGQVCGNTMSGNTGGNSVGTHGHLYDPTARCA
ncbi:nitrous oxide reductase family maturation protein NosD [Streptomyces sp. TRM68416]|uniref:right-handed parallel beta-helix repeat-containing protein n=1 Tax=Streptomyces sp. TRM68416 TaxID=2758412 RepID=UPI001661AAAA|nr:right-handed parallel beta-helix repeat-containing protein [Streptomyces sp. TRM68416]MBD0841502.1 right-handed parallel beta-helix repeat-containing protein [Streptomyces sp. TRM68416]